MVECQCNSGWTVLGQSTLKWGHFKDCEVHFVIFFSLWWSSLNIASLPSLPGDVQISRSNPSASLCRLGLLCTHSLAKYQVLPHPLLFISSTIYWWILTLNCLWNLLLFPKMLITPLVWVSRPHLSVFQPLKKIYWLKVKILHSEISKN